MPAAPKTIHFRTQPDAQRAWLTVIVSHHPDLTEFTAQTAGSGYLGRLAALALRLGIAEAHWPAEVCPIGAAVITGLTVGDVAQRFR